MLAIPAIGALADCSRRGRLIVLASTASSAVFSRIPGTLAFAIRRAGAGPVDSLGSLFRGSSILRKFKPVMAFSFTTSFTSSAICYLGRVERRIGFADSALGFLYTDQVSRPSARREHLVETYCRLVEAIGIRISNRVPKLEPTDEDRLSGRRALARFGLREKGYVCLFPGARYGPAKQWDASRFALLGDAVVDRLHLAVVLVGTGRDAAACWAVQEAMKERSLNLCGKLDFRSLMGTLEFSSAAVSNDSGGMHLAAALGLPLVGLFFSTDPQWTGPLSARSVALYNRLECSPCFARDCKRRHACTRTIEVDEVIRGLEDVLGRGV